MVSMTSIKDMDARHKGMWTYVYRGYRRTTKAVGMSYYRKSVHHFNLKK